MFLVTSEPVRQVSIKLWAACCARVALRLFRQIRSRIIGSAEGDVTWRNRLSESRTLAD